MILHNAKIDDDIKKQSRVPGKNDVPFELSGITVNLLEGEQNKKEH